MKENKIFIEDLPKKSKTPILNCCRQLLEAGYSPDSKVEFFRKNKKEPDVIVKNLGRAAKITVKDDARGRPTFVKYKKMDPDTRKRVKTT